MKETGETEVGYTIAKKLRGRGLVAEAAETFLVYGFNVQKLEKVVVAARPENMASRRVMEKLGMHYDYTSEFYGKQLAHYSINREEFYGFFHFRISSTEACVIG